ncbi:MAG: hypothetical protein A2452_10205 [Candidatus Firestonebacteria bacterium RIFOXYC2_FULL_39_67]|nr:MAG: hypothetical protein A2536_06575 [Candidatus Firestonebacteria bacterium RIFOXYD2_FULL_39_29]OGF52240.1 MAG: hypothetical protein A2497_05635 [Candidatus Firestonebacteria bacterium RifOxyC12_full_39_7]OGF54276.1 MAG: hypothetical protein A2452_10205 [Candidatus Firestonebacteria bacterium RIFOXYC2_FULL_39_67]
MSLFKRQQIYINTDLQIKMSIFLIVLVSIEVVIFGGIFSYALSMSQKVSDNIYRFYVILLLSFVGMTLLNIFLGVFLSHKIAGPIYAFEMRIKNITNGDISTFVDLRKGDMLRDFEISFNEMMHALRKAVAEDRKCLDRINKKISDLNKKLDKIGAGKEAEEMKISLKEISADMKAITSFFKI